MDIIEWNDSFVLKIEEIDNQHKQLIVLINKFSRAVWDNDLHQISKLLNELRKYAFFHFSTEEEYMEKINFNEIDKHTEEHSIFIADLLKTIARINSGKPVKLEKIIDYLKAWVFNHILVEDKKIAQFSPQK